MQTLEEEDAPGQTNTQEKKMQNAFFKMLKKDHEKVKGILGQLKETKGRAPKKREELFQKLRIELVPHMKAEGSTFYQSLMAKEAARDNAMEGMEEHHVTELVLKELGEMRKSEDQWTAKMSVFRELVTHHIKEEESKIFKVAQRDLGLKEIQNIMKKFEEEKQRIKKSFK